MFMPNNEIHVLSDFKANRLDITISDLLFDSHVAAQIGHHQVSLDKYTNDDRIHMNYTATINLVVGIL
jgi:hypothetical protein